MKDDLLARVYRTLFEAANDPERQSAYLLGAEVARRIEESDVEAVTRALGQLVSAGLIGVGESPHRYRLGFGAPAAVHTVSVVIAEWLRWQGSDEVWRGPIYLPDVANLVENGAPFRPWEPAEPSERPGGHDAARVVAEVLRRWRGDLDALPASVEGEVAAAVVEALDPDVVRLDGPRYCHAANAVVLPPGIHSCDSDAPLYAGVRDFRTPRDIENVNDDIKAYHDATTALAAMGPHCGPNYGRAETVRKALVRLPHLVQTVATLGSRTRHLNGEVDRLCRVADEAGIPALRDALEDAAAALAALAGPDADLYAREARDALHVAEAVLGHPARKHPLPSPHGDAPAKARAAFARADGLERELLALALSDTRWDAIIPLPDAANMLDAALEDVVAAARRLLQLPDDEPDVLGLTAHSEGLTGFHADGRRGGARWENIAGDDGRGDGGLPSGAERRTEDEQLARLAGAAMAYGTHAQGCVVQVDAAPAQGGEGNDGCAVPVARDEWRIARVRVSDVRKGDVVYLGPTHPGGADLGWATAQEDAYETIGAGVTARFLLGATHDGRTVPYVWQGVLDLVDVQRPADRGARVGAITVNMPMPPSAAESVRERMRDLGFGDDGAAAPA